MTGKKFNNQIDRTAKSISDLRGMLDDVRGWCHSNGSDAALDELIQFRQSIENHNGLPGDLWRAVNAVLEEVDSAIERLQEAGFFSPLDPSFRLRDFRDIVSTGGGRDAVLATASVAALQDLDPCGPRLLDALDLPDDVRSVCFSVLVPGGARNEKLLRERFDSTDLLDLSHVRDATLGAHRRRQQEQEEREAREEFQRRREEEEAAAERARIRRLLADDPELLDSVKGVAE